MTTRTTDGVYLDHEANANTLVYFAQSNPDRIFASPDECYAHYAEEGNTLNGDDDLVDSVPLGEWL